MSLFFLQFYRSFMGTAPPGVDEEDVALLVTCYGDPDRKGVVHYRKLQHDLNAVTDAMTRDGVMLSRNTDTDVAGFLPPQVGQDLCYQMTWEDQSGFTSSEKQ